jgi:gliding motility associated protien GldN
MKHLIFSLCTVCICITSYTQVIEDAGPVNNPSDGVIDGIVLKEHIPTKQLIPYEYIREADIMWERRVWQTIDLREKINQTLYYPLDEITSDGLWIKNGERWSLWSIIRHNIINGKLTVYCPFNPNLQDSKDGDQLKYPIVPQPGLTYYTDTAYQKILKEFKMLGELGVQSGVALKNQYGEDSTITDEYGNIVTVYPEREMEWITSKDIIQYRIKEDWVFDKERSVLDKRIIAIAPVVYNKVKDPNGNVSILGTRELFWLYFPECRFVFNNYYYYNDQNDAQWMSFDDLFWKRRFNSFVYKESNQYDRKVESFRKGIDALRESDRIKEEIRTFEHDLWDY